MDVRILPRPLRGAVVPPPGKSALHRLILCAGLSSGVSTIENAARSEDLDATLRCLAALGGRWEEPAPRVLRIAGAGRGPRQEGEPLPRFDCGESGTTLRFFLPAALVLRGGGIFTGRGRLMERPLQPYLNLFREKGILCQQQDGVLTVRGNLTPGEYRLPGDVSSQFFSGLLFALPLLDGASTIRAVTPLESADYVLMTQKALRLAGVATAAQTEPGCFQVSPAEYRPFAAAAEADWSQAAFWLAAAFPGEVIQINGLNFASVQGDRRIEDFFQELSAPGDRVIDLSSCPDLLPPLAVMAAVRTGTVRFVHAERTRLKESDRLSASAALINALGGTAREAPDALEVRGGTLYGGAVENFHDHRIVMAAAAAAAHCTEPVVIRGADAVKKSYPSFWDDYKRLGGDLDVL